MGEQYCSCHKSVSIQGALHRRLSLSENVGLLDRIVRFIIGLVLLAFAVPIGLPQVGWNWVGYIGVVFLLTSIFAYCPAYSIFGSSKS